MYDPWAALKRNETGMRHSRKFNSSFNSRYYFRSIVDLVLASTQVLTLLCSFNLPLYQMFSLNKLEDPRASRASRAWDHDDLGLEFTVYHLFRLEVRVGSTLLWVGHNVNECPTNPRILKHPSTFNATPDSRLRLLYHRDGITLSGLQDLVYLCSREAEPMPAKFNLIRRRSVASRVSLCSFEARYDFTEGSVNTPLLLTIGYSTQPPIGLEANRTTDTGLVWFEVLIASSSHSGTGHRASRGAIRSALPPSSSVPFKNSSLNANLPVATASSSGSVQRTTISTFAARTRPSRLRFSFYFTHHHPYLPPYVTLLARAGSARDTACGERPAGEAARRERVGRVRTWRERRASRRGDRTRRAGMEMGWMEMRVEGMYRERGPGEETGGQEGAGARGVVGVGEGCRRGRQRRERGEHDQTVAAIPAGVVIVEGLRGGDERIESDKGERGRGLERSGLGKAGTGYWRRSATGKGKTRRKRKERNEFGRWSPQRRRDDDDAFLRHSSSTTTASAATGLSTCALGCIEAAACRLRLQASLRCTDNATCPQYAHKTPQKIFLIFFTIAENCRDAIRDQGKPCPPQLTTSLSQLQLLHHHSQDILFITIGPRHTGTAGMFGVQEHIMHQTVWSTEYVFNTSVDVVAPRKKFCVSDISLKMGI
ncbi:hypothetical protein B0H16DRAFT_1789866 [Mycena metata]|uniref:Uncharacterized protein n=1 Tax=Mycena metata TaxID=1033252 RepID=A0AAD7MLG3_9AGAR|nr:hypothetical protein B0H16DRAFT_1789866 [Mycena metata]